MVDIKVFSDKYKGRLIAEVSSFDALIILDKNIGFNLEPNQILINGDCMEDLPTTRARFKQRKELMKKL